MFGWPSGLGSRLQNEIGRFDSDSKLKKKIRVWPSGLGNSLQNCMDESPDVGSNPTARANLIGSVA